MVFNVEFSLKSLAVCVCVFTQFPACRLPVEQFLDESCPGQWHALNAAQNKAHGLVYKQGDSTFLSWLVLFLASLSNI